MNDRIKKVFEILGVKPREIFKLGAKDNFLALHCYYCIHENLDVFYSDRIDGIYAEASHIDIKRLLANEIHFIQKLDKKDLLTEDDWTVLKYLALEDADIKYIARDECGALMVYTKKPYKIKYVWDGCSYEAVPRKTFSFVTWEDDEPLFIGDWLEELKKGEKR